MHVLVRLCGDIVQMFSDLARRNFFSMRGVFLPRIFCGGVGRRFTTYFHGIFCSGFYHGFSRILGTDFHSFFMAVGGIILGSMSEKIVGIFVLNK